MRELREGVWHWQAPHPQWESTEPWDKNVSSYVIADDERLLLFDPVGVPRDIEALAAERETAIVLTAPWHERDSEGLVELGEEIAADLRPLLELPVEHVLATNGRPTDRAARERALSSS